MGRKIVLSGLLCCFAFLLASAQEKDDRLHARVKGFIDTYHALRTESPNDWMSSRTRIRGELTLEKGNAGMFVSMNAVYNAILKDQTGLFLREAYLYYSKNAWDLRAGRQIVTWGVADAMRLTDIVSPMDFTEYLAQDYDDIRIPVNAVRLRYVRSKWSAEAILIPVSSFFELPTDPGNPWSVRVPGVTLPYTLSTGETPAKKFSNMEFGGRVGVYLSGVDFSFYALRAWNKMPVFRKTWADDGASLCCEGEYRRMTMLGADLSVPLGKFVLRAEIAEYLGEAQDPAPGAGVTTGNSLNILGGVDWYPGGDWNVGVQYSHKYIGGCGPETAAYRNSGMATLRLSKDLLHNSLNLSTFAYVDVSNGGVYNRLSADYAFTDQIHALVGYDLFHADAGMFAMYGRNSEVWIKLKYNF